MWSKANENRTKQLCACMWSLGLLVGWGGWGKRQAVYARWCQSDFPCRPRRNHGHGQCSSGRQRAGSLQNELWKSGSGPQMPRAWEVALFFSLGVPCLLGLLSSPVWAWQFGLAPQLCLTASNFSVIIYMAHKWPRLDPSLPLNQLCVLGLVSESLWIRLNICKWQQ